MASIKISELNEATELNSNDLIPVVDTINDETKKMTYENVKTQIINDNFAVITGTFRGTAGWEYISYPDGYTKDNCVVVSAMKDEGAGFYTFTDYDADTTVHYVPLILFLSSNMQLYDAMARNKGKSYTYKIVLMKIS